MVEKYRALPLAGRQMVHAVLDGLSDLQEQWRQETPADNIRTIPLYASPAAAGFAAPEAAFLSSPHPARAPVRVRAANDSAIAFFHFFVMMIPLSFFYPTLLHRE